MAVGAFEVRAAAIGAPGAAKVAPHGSLGPSRCVFQVIDPNLVPTPFAVAVCGLSLAASDPHNILLELKNRIVTLVTYR